MAAPDLTQLLKVAQQERNTTVHWYQKKDETLADIKALEDQLAEVDVCGGSFEKVIVAMLRCSRACS
jgi:hypothetical protein